MNLQATFTNPLGQAKTLDIKDGLNLQDAYNVVANDDFAPTQITLEATNMNSSDSNVEPDKQVETAYDLIGKHSINDIIDKHKISTDELAVLLEEGTNHELEHTSSYLIAMKIAQDHLYEDLRYYSKLKEAMLARGAVLSMTKSTDKIRFEKGGLIAPNGKPSNLTPEQYELVRTPEFKAWFGDWENAPNDNMLIDKNGEPMIWWHTGGDWNKLNDDGINGKGKLMFSPTKSSMAYGRDGEQTITRPFFIKSDFIYMLPYEDRDTTSAYRWNKNKKNPVWFVNAYGGFVVVRQSNQIKLADGTNTTFDGKTPDIRFDKGGYVSEDILIDNNIDKIDDIYVFSEDDKPVKSLGQFTFKGFGKYVMQDLAAELYDDYKIRLRSDFAIMLGEDVIKPSIKVAQMKGDKMELLAIIYNAMVTEEMAIAYVYNEDGEMVGKFTDEDEAEEMVNDNDGYYSEVRVEEVTTPETILAMQFDFKKHEMTFISTLLDKENTHKFKYGGKL